MKEKLFDPSVLEMMEEFKKIAQSQGIDFFIAGAIARDIRLSINPEMKAIRRTKDVDIALMVTDEHEFYKMKEALLATGNFTDHSTEAIKLFYKQSIELDLLPFGEIENHVRETRLYKPRLFVMDMPGFSEIMPYVDTVDIDGGLDCKVCTLEGLVLLKLIANDNNSSRVKDITDIEHIVSVYFELCMDDIFSDNGDAAELYDTNANNYMELVAARVIGRKIKTILKTSEQLHERVLSILEKRTKGVIWQAMAAGMRDDN
ncbi:hypothetical protein [Pseudoflavitalea rhizosphaerae]|uniref:hypothetical protein n=1 Tax=Pseudoflavitalea rhizosphaerae TaxID=1884793 RepID=UPI000F8CEB53|nr:hypothetical protein [Pseudoflavitalea rhizosphaerae]